MLPTKPEHVSEVLTRDAEGKPTTIVWRETEYGRQQRVLRRAEAAERGKRVAESLHSHRHPSGKRKRRWFGLLGPEDI